MVEESIKDFFISYNKADRGWAEWIAWQLENEGYNTILQAWDFRPGSNFILEMDRATKVAKRTIAVLSPDYLDALYTQPEWAEALRQDPTGQKGKLLPMRVRACTLEGLLASIVYIDLVGLNALAAQNALRNGVGRSRAIPSMAPIFPGDASPQQSSASPAFPGNWPLVWNVPYRRNPFFTGREMLLKSLHAQLTGSKAAALTQMLAIHGLGGIGKTQTAVEYAYRYQHEYQAVLWVRAAARDTLISDYVTIADLLHLTEQDKQDQTRMVEAVKQWFTRQQNWLLILDNADDLEIVPDFLPASQKGHLLLTTRDPAVEGMAQSIEVEQMDVREGIELLLQRSRVLAAEAPLEQTSQEDRTTAERIVKEMAGLPLAIDQAGAYIEQTRCGLVRYLDLYQQHRADLLKWKRRVRSDYSGTVASTWELAFEQVEQRNPAAADLLRLSAFLDPDSIPEDLVTAGASELGPVLQPVVEDPFSFNEALDLLRSFSLIRRLADTQSISIHRLVQVVLKERMDHSTQQQWAERTMRLVDAAFPEVEFKTWDRCKRYLHQVFACLALMDQPGIHTKEAASLLYRGAWYLHENARNREAEPLYQKALTIREQELGPQHPHVGSTLNNLAQLYYEQGRYEEAEPLYQRALTIKEGALGPQHLSTATTFNNLAQLYYAQGRYEEAEPLYQRALTIRERALGPQHPSTATILNNLAQLYHVQGRYEEAEPLYQQALTIREQALGPEYTFTASTLNNLAQLYYKQGRYEEAEPLYQRALTIKEGALGPQHPHVGSILNNLAQLYYAQGRYEEAEPFYQRAQTIRERALGPQHPFTASTLNDLAQLYYKQGRYEEAEPLYQQALTIREHVLPAKHSELISP